MADELTLPVELIIIIFDFAAASCKDTALSISLLCSWARVAVAKHVFSTLVLRGHMPSPEIIPETVRSLVRNLWIENIGANWRRAIPFFSSLMPDLERIALPGFYLWAMLEALKEKESAMIRGVRGSVVSEGRIASSASFKYPCRSLFVLPENPSLIWKMFDEYEPSRNFMAGITHIRIQSLRMSAFIPLRGCPNSTHIAFPLWEFTPYHYDTLDNIFFTPTVQKFVLMIAKPPPNVSPPYTLEDLSLAHLASYVRFRQSVPIIKIHIAFAERKAQPDEWKEKIHGRRSIWDSAVPFVSMMDGTFFAELEARHWIFP
ncbi:hypothetical protein NEOLEDRAFT_476516 [Neolentinus lepideus HHB14362 ss-1]|uniref:F-box domain-containing protein n=1 Tax=Neolentinus lepideus HHB14362 ss-1 TaxID=1314782 RepID=A0A165VKG1_9AGAM|nr:hypothetical protein NEOLEDRAFT_476516 [Neolentinus lepideus HHB14362 ss-1]